MRTHNHARRFEHLDDGRAGTYDRIFKMLLAAGYGRSAAHADAARAYPKSLRAWNAEHAQRPQPAR